MKRKQKQRLSVGGFVSLPNIVGRLCQTPSKKSAHKWRVKSIRKGVITLALLLLLLAPSLCFGAYTEFYCVNGGSNLNSGSTTSTSPAYSSSNGGWNSGTGVFTPTDGTNPSSTVNPGDWASVHLDAATAAVFIGRVTAVQNASNGTITVSLTAKAGTAPSTNGSGRSIKVGGAWSGPTAAVSTPFDLTWTASSSNASGDRPRINMKDDHTYGNNSGPNFNTISELTIQGYHSTPGDKGRAKWTTSTAGTGWSINNCANSVFADLELECTASSGSTFGIQTGGTNVTLLRIVVHGFRGSGFSCSGGSANYKVCESYANNKANGSTDGGFKSTAQCNYSYCYSHDHSGSNGHGWYLNATGTTVQIKIENSIADTDGGHGVFIDTSSAATIDISQSDFYNQTGDGVKYGGTSTTNGSLNIINSNFTKNGGKGINMTNSHTYGYVDNNGYGAGSEANGASDTLGALVDSGTSVIYPSNTTPYSAPTTGNFSIVLPGAMNAGRGAFTQTDGTNSGTVGYPDIGAAQHNDTCSGTGPCQTSAASAY